jgi:cell division septation protein DedD
MPNTKTVPTEDQFDLGSLEEEFNLDDLNLDDGGQEPLEAAMDEDDSPGGLDLEEPETEAQGEEPEPAPKPKRGRPRKEKPEAAVGPTADDINNQAELSASGEQTMIASAVASLCRRVEALEARLASAALALGNGHGTVTASTITVEPPAEVKEATPKPKTAQKPKAKADGRAKAAAERWAPPVTHPVTIGELAKRSGKAEANVYAFIRRQEAKLGRPLKNKQHNRYVFTEKQAGQLVAAMKKVKRGRPRSS